MVNRLTFHKEAEFTHATLEPFGFADVKHVSVWHPTFL